MSSGEKKAVLVGWVGIIAVACWFLWPSKEAPVIQPLAPTEGERIPLGPVYSKGGPDALKIAKQLMADLDRAMQDSSGVATQGDLQALGAHSRRFNDLAASAKAQFGSTIGDPLGRCGIASGNARSWWHAQLAARKDGVEPIPGAIREFLGQYQENRKTCLEIAGTETHG